MDAFARMQAFVAVVEAGGFSAAARKLGRSKALISKYVRELEDGLGVRLMNRTTRQLSLTEAGQSYHREASEILQRIEDLESGLSDAHREPRGRLRVAGPRTLGDGLLGEIVMEFLQAEPHIQLSMTLEDRFVDLVEEGYDVAIRITELADSSFITRRLAPFRMVTCGRPDLIGTLGTPLAPRDLTDLPCIVDSNARNRSNWTYKVDGHRVSVPVRGRVEVNSPAATRLAALAGLGFAQIPYIVVREDLAAGRLVTFLDEYENSASGIHIVYPHRRHLSGKVRAFVDHVALWFEKAARSGEIC